MPDINVKIEEPEAIIIKIGEPEPINIQIVESEPINVTINEMAPTLISDIFNPPEDGHRVTKLYVNSEKKFEVEYEV